MTSPNAAAMVLTAGRIPECTLPTPDLGLSAPVLMCYVAVLNSSVLQAWMLYNLVSAACLVLFVIPKGATSSTRAGYKYRKGRALLASLKGSKYTSP